MGDCGGADGRCHCLRKVATAIVVEVVYSYTAAAAVVIVVFIAMPLQPPLRTL